MIETANLVSALIGALIGTALPHLFSSWRDTKNKRRETILNNLIEIYEAFDASPLIDPNTEKLKIELAVAKIQLFGDEKLISLCEDFCNKLKRNGNANTTLPMEHVRGLVRSELRLPNTSKHFTILRFNELKILETTTSVSAPKVRASGLKPP